MLELDVIDQNTTPETKRPLCYNTLINDKAHTHAHTQRASSLFLTHAGVGLGGARWADQCQRLTSSINAFDTGGFPSHATSHRGTLVVSQCQ